MHAHGKYCLTCKHTCATAPVIPQYAPMGLQAAFGVDLAPAWVMELESDAPHKFSRHLIIQIPGMAFANNLHVGSFVSAVCSDAVNPDSGSSSLQVAKVIPTCLIINSTPACTSLDVIRQAFCCTSTSVRAAPPTHPPDCSQVPVLHPGISCMCAL